MTCNAWLLELRREPWAMEPRALEAFLGRVADAVQSGRMPAQAAPTPSRDLVVDKDGVASIPIKGALLKSVPWYFAFFDIAATAYSDIGADLEAAMSDPNVKAIRLDVDSPGGQAMGAKGAADAIFAARQAKTKPITARVDDMAASAAYYLASQAERIQAVPMSVLGSIGTYLAVVDVERLAKNEGVEVDVIRSGQHKGAGIPGTRLTPEQRGELQAFVDGLSSQFVADVARGRAVQRAKVEEWATGKTWFAEEAVREGLADSVLVKSAPAQSKKNEIVSGQAQGSGAQPEAVSHECAPENRKGDPPMTEQEKRELEAKAADAALAKNQERVSALQAAFGEKDAAFTLKAIAQGWPVQEAKAQWADVVEARSKVDREARLDAEKRLEAAQKPGVAGAPPVPAGKPAEPGASQQKDFMALSMEYAQEHKCGMVAAMRHVSQTRPEVHRAFLQASADKAPEVKARKIKLGMTV